MDCHSREANSPDCFGLHRRLRARTHRLPRRTKSDNALAVCERPGVPLSEIERRSRRALFEGRPILYFWWGHRERRSVAGIDREDYGPRVALSVARELVVFLKRSGGQK